jgi:hypothetical protein
MTVFESRWLRDTSERALATFAQAALGVWILAGPGDVFNVTVLEGAGAAGLIAALSVVKSALASKVGNPDSASLDKSL